jgi:chemotaxis methyl-accepting protein methylase
VRELVRAFLIKVAGFFRDPEAFDYIKKYMLPELIDRGASRGACCGCGPPGAPRARSRSRAGF